MTTEQLKKAKQIMELIDEVKKEIPRAKFSEVYYFVGYSSCSVCEAYEMNHRFDDERHERGNYFLTEEQAQRAADKLKSALDEFLEGGVKMKISNKNESTAYPFWIIINPHQNFSKGSQGLHNIAGMITGVWFSREAAEEYLSNHRYNFGEGARVYCHSGCYSEDWKELTNQLKATE